MSEQQAKGNEEDLRRLIDDSVSCIMSYADSVVVITTFSGNGKTSIIGSSGGNEFAKVGSVAAWLRDLRGDYEEEELVSEDDPLVDEDEVWEDDDDY